MPSWANASRSAARPRCRTGPAAGRAVPEVVRADACSAMSRHRALDGADAMHGGVPSVVLLVPILALLGLAWYAFMFPVLFR